MADSNVTSKRNICKIEGCGRFCFGHGYCGKHYARYRRGLDPSQPTRRDPNQIVVHNDYAEIILRNNQHREIARTKVDIEDLPILKQYIWSFNVLSGYAYSHSHGPTVMMHKLIAKTPEGMLTDHINGERLDNRKTNLRYATNTENAQHMSPWAKNTKHSKYKGVCILHNREYPLKKPWIAYIGVNGKRQYLGYFATDEEAANAYDNAAREQFREYARLNFR